MSAQQSMAWGEAPSGTEQPWIVTFKDGTTARFGATSRWAALRKLGKRTVLREVVSCEPATLSLFGGGT